MIPRTWTLHLVNARGQLASAAAVIEAAVAEAGGRLERAVSQAIADWHRSGQLMALERKWSIPVSHFTRQMNRTWNRRDRDRFYCGDPAADAASTMPRECL